MEKKRINIYIDNKLIELAHLEENNISALINDLLETYLSVNSTEEIDKKITEHKKIIHALQTKKEKLLQQGISETAKEGIIDQITNQLHTLYMKRRTQLGDSHDLDLDWLNSPKNLQRCRLLGKEPLQLVMELRDWYSNNNGGL